MTAETLTQPGPVVVPALTRYEVRGTTLVATPFTGDEREVTFWSGRDTLVQVAEALNSAGMLDMLPAVRDTYWLVWGRSRDGLVTIRADVARGGWSTAYASVIVQKLVDAGLVIPVPHLHRTGVVVPGFQASVAA